MAISATGSNIVVLEGSPSSIHTSTNGGATWMTPSNPPTDSQLKITSSGDGKRLGVLGWNTRIFTSADGAASWSTNNDAPVAVWTGITSSADGRRLAATGSGVWISTNYGVNWSSVLAAAYPMSIACSADGKRLVAVGNKQVFISPDFGATWTTNAVSQVDGTATISSADGSCLGTMSYFGLNVSTNSGETWTLTWTYGLAGLGAAVSADGHRWMACSNGGLTIGTSSPTPVLHIAPSNSDATISWIIPSSPLVLQQKGITE